MAAMKRRRTSKKMVARGPQGRVKAKVRTKAAPKRRKSRAVASKRGKDASLRLVKNFESAA